MALVLVPKKPKPGQRQFYHVRFRLNTGKRDKNGRFVYTNYTRSIGERGKITKTQAQEIHDRLKLRIKGGVASEFIVYPPALGEFSEEFISHKRDVEQIRAAERYEYSAAQLINFFGGGLKLSEITPRRIDEYKAHRLKTVKPGTVNRELTCLKAMINLAAKWNQFKGENPVSKAGLLDEIRDEMVPVSYDEEDLLLPALNPHLSRICEFDLNTGMRIEEVLILSESMIDFGRRIAKLEATQQKGKKTREVPLNDRAIELIGEGIEHGKQFRNPKKIIFLNRHGTPYAGHDSIRPAVVRACKKAGIRKIHPHLLRHTFITRAIENGADPISVREIVGHANLKTLLRYVHLKDSKARAVNMVMRPGKGRENAA